MKRVFLLLSALLTAISNPVLATKLVNVKIVDKDYLMIYFQDGEVVYHEDPVGPDAYKDVEDNDMLVDFGKELNVDIADASDAWTIVAAGDPDYGTIGRHPVAAYRKSKVNNTTHDWHYKLDHWIFLKLPFPLKQNVDYTLKIPAGTNSDVTEQHFSFHIFKDMSEAVHVNIVGYTPESPVKSADLYLWMGDGGQRDYHSFEGNTVWIYNVDTGEKDKVGKVTFWKSDTLKTEAEGRNLTGSDVWNIDFTGFTKPGKYRLAVEGVGCSQDFEIRKDIFFVPFKTAVRGYYYMRIGEPVTNLRPVPRQPRFIPGKDPKGFTVYLTDLDPYDEVWKARRGDVWDEPHFRPASTSIFWAHRLPGNPTNPNAYGGHSDALDWDRHLSHVSNIYDLLLPYFLTNGKIAEDDLDIRESGNGIPDIMDEARNEVDFWMRLRDGDAYCQGLTNPSSEQTIMFQAGKTTMAAWANAANCAMMADCFRILGSNELKEYYTKEAITAFNFAGKQDNLQLDDKLEIGKAVMRGRDFRMMAAAFLYNVTGDRKWEDIMAQESVVKDGNSKVEDRQKWEQIWGTAAYLLSPQKRHYPQLYENMKSAIRKQAIEHNVSQVDIRPSRRSSNDNYWQTAENLDLVIVAHAISDDPAEKEQFKRAMILEVDWGMGRNPTNTVEMTGLGERNIVNCYTSGQNDGVPGLDPGHTPYDNLDNWGGRNNGSNPQWFVQKCYPEWVSGGWPFQEAFFNCRYSWANGEFTPRETMRGKAALYAYLYGITDK